MYKSSSFKNPLTRLIYTIKAGEAARTILEKHYRKVTNTENSIWSLRDYTTDELIEGIINALRQKENKK